MKLRYEEIKLIIETFNDYNKAINDEWNDSLNVEQEALLNKLQEAINYSQCCETLKGKEEIPFEEWKKLNGIMKSGCGTTYTNKNQDVFQEWELIDMYNCEVMNF